MRPFTKHAAGIGALMLAALVGLGSAARAQAPTSYYYPSAGWYATTAGPVYIAAPGSYYNVPASVPSAAPVVAPPSWGYSPSWAPSYGYAPGYRYVPRGVSRGPRSNNPPFYSGAQHSLHGRGFDSGSHGR
jgi:hypothetical protein